MSEKFEFSTGLYGGRSYKVLRTAFLLEKVTGLVTPYNQHHYYYESGSKDPLLEVELQPFYYKTGPSTSRGGNTLLGLFIFSAGNIARNRETSDIILVSDNEDLYNSSAIGKDITKTYKERFAQGMLIMKDFLQKFNAAKSILDSSLFELCLPLQIQYYMTWERQEFFDDYRYNTNHSIFYKSIFDNYFTLDVTIYAKELDFLIDFFNGVSHQQLVEKHGLDFTHEMIGAPCNPFEIESFNKRIEDNYEKMIKVFKKWFPNNGRKATYEDQQQKEILALLSKTIQKYEQNLFMLNYN